MFDLDFTSKPWNLLLCTADEFFIGMSALGMYQDINLVGAFAADPNDPTVRTAHRDTDLPWHRDGIFTKAIADMQGGKYVEKPDVDIVGMYCLRANPDWKTITTLSADRETIDAEINLQPGQALVWDNRMWHGRRGPVGPRLLVRFWTTCNNRPLLDDGQRAISALLFARA